jgi:hypothetical protein
MKEKALILKVLSHINAAKKTIIPINKKKYPVT